MAATDSIVRYIITPDPNEKRYDLVIAVDKDDNGNVTINHKLLIESSDQIGMTETEAEIAAGSIFGECSNISAVLCLSARPGCMLEPKRRWVGKGPPSLRQTVLQAVPSIYGETPEARQV